MALNTITRGAVGAYTKLARTPFDVATRLLGRDADSGLRAGAGLAIDQAEATALGVAGRLFGDAELQDEAARRFVAADERRQALRLRERAQEVSEDADERLAASERQAERTRGQGRESAARRKQQADRRKDRKTTQAARAEEARRDANREVAAKRKETVAERAKIERLEAAEEKVEALDRKEEALAAQDEAQRLGRAAAATKARRTRSTSARR